MTKSSLLTRCKNGDQAGWKLLYDNYVRSVYRWGLFMGLKRHQAEDVTQEVFMTAVKNIGDCQSEKKLPSWLFQITRRHAANARRKAWVRRVLRFPDGDLDAFLSQRSDAGMVSSHELNPDLHRVLARLPLNHASVLIMADMEGFKRDEIAQMLQIPPGTVASRLRKARDLFSKLWQADGGEK